jgi:hypothetical protein
MSCSLAFMSSDPSEPCIFPPTALRYIGLLRSPPVQGEGTIGMVYGRDPRVDGHQEEEHDFGVTPVTRPIHEGTVSVWRADDDDLVKTHLSVHGGWGADG